MMFRAMTIAALAGFVSANSYSIGCMNSLMLIGQNTKASACLKPAQLIPVMVGASNGPESIIGYFDTWLGSMCGAPACSDTIIYEVLNNLTRDCSDEFGLGGTPDQVKQTTLALKRGYKTVRKIACLKDTNSDGINCVTGTLRNVESLTGVLNLNETSITSIASYIKKGFPKDVICTNCMKGAFSLLNKNLPGSFSDSDKKYATDLCGESFADGGIPPGLVSTAFEGSAAKSVTTSTTSPTPTSTPRPSSTPSPVVTSTPSPTPTKKNSALRRSAVLSSGTFMAISGLVAFGVGMV